MTGVGARAVRSSGGGDDDSEDSENRSSQGQLADSLDPFDRNIKYSLSVGITTGCVQLSAGGGR